MDNWRASGRKYNDVCQKATQAFPETTHENHPRWLVPRPTFETGCLAGTLNNLLAMHPVRISADYWLRRLIYFKIMLSNRRRDVDKVPWV
jgi:hypothetical protein